MILIYILVAWYIYVLGVFFFERNFSKAFFQGERVSAFSATLIAIVWPIIIPFLILLAPLGIIGYFLKKKGL